MVSKRNKNMFLLPDVPSLARCTLKVKSIKKNNFMLESSDDKGESFQLFSSPTQ